MRTSGTAGQLGQTVIIGTVPAIQSRAAEPFHHHTSEIVAISLADKLIPMSICCLRLLQCGLQTSATRPGELKREAARNMVGDKSCLERMGLPSILMAKGGEEAAECWNSGLRRRMLPRGNWWREEGGEGQRGWIR